MLDFLISPEANFELEESRKILETKKVVYVLSVSYTHLRAHETQ